VQGNNLAGPQVLDAMGRAFEATRGELAEKLFAALKAGDDSGGDSRGKQSASMVVVRKRGGRNIDNDRYVYINVDDNPTPIRELRRLLDINLGLLYSEKVGPLLIGGKTREARDAATQAAHYMPTADSYFFLGTMDYGVDDKSSALADFRKAIKLDSGVRQRFQASADKVPQGYGVLSQALQQILHDKDFLKQVMSE
jgi:tetratricopeptide (TPR) repeat protein